MSATVRFLAKKYAPEDVKFYPLSRKDKRVLEGDELKHRLNTRVNDRKFAELKTLLARSRNKDMSALIRDILYNRPVKIVVRDETLDNVMEELARVRTEIRAIGVNINQITRHFNTYPEPQRKVLYAKVAFKEYQAIDAKIEQLLVIVAKLAKRWLSG